MDAMQTRETIEYDVKTLLQTVLDTTKEPDEIRKRIKRGGYDVKI